MAVDVDATTVDGLPVTGASSASNCGSGQKGANNCRFVHNLRKVVINNFCDKPCNL